MNVLDLFSGIGGFSLGLERAGMRTVAFCEIEPYCRAVLAKHWPSVPIYDDVRTLTKQRLDADGISVELICGGFPCQDISNAGKRVGIEGERSGLWSEYARIIGEVRPQYVVVENVAALLGRGLERVLGDLAAFGFDAEWHCIPASAVGAPHRRDRIWIIAHAQRGAIRCEGCAENASAPGEVSSEIREQRVRADTRAVCCGRDVAHADSARFPSRSNAGAFGKDARDEQAGPGLGERSSLPHAAYVATIGEGIRRGDAAGIWRIEPDVGRMAHGVPSRVDRLRALGNAVVPQIPEIIGRAIMKAHLSTNANVGPQGPVP